jgi:hypothetical protein
MKSIIHSRLLIAALLFAIGSFTAGAQSSELDFLKAQMQIMKENMEKMQKAMDELQRQKTAPPQPTSVETNSPSMQLMERVVKGLDIGETSPIQNRRSFNDQQEGAPRPNDLTLDPKYRGFVPIPNTPVLIKFNAKPHLDMISDTRNAGNPDRFVPAQIPVSGQTGFGGSEQFNVNARASQLRMDVRAPEMDGNLRFYYQNDFFGSGNGMQYRLQHLYGQFYNVTAGFTYSCFEDPDAWPDTVDYEGPNAVIWARRPLVRYMLPICKSWQLNFGIEAPGAEIDSNSTTNSFNQNNPMPDATINARWENERWGHVQLGAVFRDIGAHSSTGNQNIFGYGVNLASSINMFRRDSLQSQFTYGEGIFRYFNDNFMNNDAAFNSTGDLEALPVYGATVGYTHHWCDSLRSTATYGYVNIDNQLSQGPDAYHQTHYASVNVVWQLRKRLSVGLEALYGKKETQSGATGDVWRFQLGLVYSLFD